MPQNKRCGLASTFRTVIPTIDGSSEPLSGIDRGGPREMIHRTPDFTRSRRSLQNPSCNLELRLKEILTRFKAKAGEEGWKSVAGIQGIRHIALTYAVRHNLDPPPSRKRS